MGLYIRFCYNIGVKRVGLPRKGALLTVTTGRNMVGGLNTLTSQEWTQPTWHMPMKIPLRRLLLLSVHQKSRNLQRKGKRSEREESCRMKSPPCMMSRQPCVNITEQTAPQYTTAIYIYVCLFSLGIVIWSLDIIGSF